MPTSPQRCEVGRAIPASATLRWPSASGPSPSAPRDDQCDRVYARCRAVRSSMPLEGAPAHWHSARRSHRNRIDAPPASHTVRAHPPPRLTSRRPNYRGPTRSASPTPKQAPRTTRAPHPINALCASTIHPQQHIAASSRNPLHVDPRSANSHTAARNAPLIWTSSRGAVARPNRSNTRQGRPGQAIDVLLVLFVGGDALSEIGALHGSANRLEHLVWMEGTPAKWAAEG